MSRLHSGNVELDAILGGGFPGRAIHIVMGAPGTGKTILAEQLCFANASPGRPILYLATFSEPLQKLVDHLQRFSFAQPETIGTEVVYEYIGEDLLTAPERLPERIQNLLTLHRPKIIVIDSFKALADLMPDRSAWRCTLDAVAGLLSAYDSTSFWVGEYTASMLTDLPEFAVADGIVDLTRVERGSRDERFLRVLKLRGSDFLSGQHPFRVNADGMQAFRRFVAATPPPSYRTGQDRVKSGVTGLDTLIATGWLRGTATLVAGPSGAGKTSLGMHFLKAGADDGEAGLLVSFQENPTQLMRTMTSFGWSPEDMFGAGKLDHLYASPVELQIDLVAHEIVRRIENNAVKRVVIDAATDVQEGAADRDRYREFLYSLTQMFAQRNVTSMLIAEATESQSWNYGISTSEVARMSDNIIQLELRLTAELDRTIRVVKSRGSAHDDRRLPLHITARGITVG